MTAFSAVAALALKLGRATDVLTRALDVGVRGAWGTFPAIGTEQSIRIAALAAIAAGGGTVTIPAGVIQITQPLPIGKNLRYRGAAQAALVDKGSIPASGTILLGDGVLGVTPGTFNGIECNPVDSNVLPANSDVMFASAPLGMAIKNIVFRGFKHGIKGGANKACGFSNLVLDNVVAEHCDWGFWLENCYRLMVPSTVMYQHCRLGGFYNGCSTGTVWNHGNGVVNRVVGQNTLGLSNRNSKGIVIETRGLASQLNNMRYHSLQANGIKSDPIVQASAPIFTAGSANIAITGNISQYARDAVVIFGTTVGNFSRSVPWIIYDVTDNGDGTGAIQVADSKGGTPQVATVTGSSTITYKGATLIEIGGNDRGGNASTLLTNCVIAQMDAEDAGTASLLYQRCGGCHVETSIIDDRYVSVLISRLAGDNHLTMRRRLENFYTQNRIGLLGMKPNSIFGANGSPPLTGFLSDATSHALFMSGRGSAGLTGDVFMKDPLGATPVVNFAWPIAPLQAQLSAGAAFSTFLGGSGVYTGGAGGTMTIPDVTDKLEGAILFLVNPSAGNLTVTTPGGQNLVGNGVSAASLVIPAATTVMVIASRNVAAYFWAVK